MINDLKENSKMYDELIVQI